MSNKPFDKLNALDTALRHAKPAHGPDVPDIKLTIELIHGFELFNTRPYHNYETWSDGWRISDGTTTVEAEDLDDAVAKFVEAVASVKSATRA